MKRWLPHTGRLLIVAGMLAPGLRTRADWPVGRALCLGFAELTAASPAETKDKPSTPAEQLQMLQKQFNEAAYSFWQPTNEQVRTQLVARVDAIPSQLLELAEKNPKDPA